MITRVKDLMKSGGLRECEIIAGHGGMDREVKYVTIMEVPDILNWLKGNELLLTSLYPLKDDMDAQKNLIKQLYENGTAAVAIKPNRFVSDIQHILDEADKYGLPIIEIPMHISYLNILSPAISEINNQKIILQDDIEQADQLLNEISFNNQGIEYFLEAISSLTKNTVTLECDKPYITVPDPPFVMNRLSKVECDEIKLMKRPIRIMRTVDGTEVDCVVAPLMIDDESQGYLTCWGLNEAHTKFDFAILQKASTLLVLELLKNKVKYEVEQQYINQFLYELLTDGSLQNESDIDERARFFSFSLTKPYIIALLRHKDPVKKVGFELLQSAIKTYNTSWIIGEMGDFSIILVPCENEEDRNHFNKFFTSHLKRYGVNDYLTHIGIGRDGTGIKELRNSYLEAKKACILGERMEVSKIFTYYDELSLFSLIGNSSSWDLEQFYKKTILPLVNHDDENDQNLLGTLNSYFQHNEQLQQTANSLFLHVNTLKYRLNRIEKITGLSLKNSEEKLSLFIGIKVYQLLKIESGI